MNKIDITTIVAIALVYVFSCTPALADYNFDGWPVETRLNGTVNGGVFIDYVPWDGSRDLSLTTTMPNGTVKWAHLYTGIWGGRESYKGWVNVTFNGVADQNGLGPIHLQGEDDTNQHVWCTSHGKYWMFYNVTGLVDAGTLNTARVRKINETYGAFDGRVYGIVLIAIYEDGDNPKNIQYWINDGNDAFHYADATWPPVAHDTGTTYFNGTVDVANVSRANLTVVHLTAYDPSCSSGMTFNDHPLNTSMVDTNTFELNTWNVSSYVTASENLVWFTRCEDAYINVPLAILTLEKSPDLIATAIKPYHYEWSEEYNCSKGEPWFNLTNYVNVTVYNNGTGNAGPFVVTLYANETQIGAEPINGLPAGATIDVKFEWKPKGEDPLSWIDTAEGAICAYTDTSKEYVLRAVVDEDDKVSEDNEENNELTKEQEVVWNGFTGDEPLDNSLHGNVNGGIIYTTGDGQYRGVNCYGTKYGTYYDVNYDLALPGNVTVARLYLYYTWAQPSYTAPKIGIKLKEPFGTVHTLSMEQSYNDIKGDFDVHRFVWGTYVFDITDYINKSGTYTVNITNLNDGGDSDFATDYAFAAPAMLVVYENRTMPEREYWLTEGADILLGGRRSKGGFLELTECQNTARFLGDIEVNKVKEAKLGVVAPWAGVSWEPGMTTYLYFNDVELGRGVYSGYGRAYTISMEGLTMTVGADDAQIGVNATDVTAYLNASANEAIQGDDGDCMMPSSAILLLTQEEDILDTGLPESRYPSISGTHNGSITVDTNITVSSLYTYQCPGTGGHTEFIRIWNETTGACVEGHWDGYQGDYQTISLNQSITLKKGVTYLYTIQTGSYPQIHHQKELPVDGGIVTCEKFTDANGREHDNWIPAFILY